MLTAPTELFTVPSGDPMGGREDKETGRDSGPSSASGGAQHCSVLCGDISLNGRETTFLTSEGGDTILPTLGIEGEAKKGVSYLRPPS